MKFKIKSTNDEIVVDIWGRIKEYITRGSNTKYTCFSIKYGFYFSSVSEYWQEIGKRNALVEVIARNKTGIIHGCSFFEVLQRIAPLEFGTGIGIILYNINTYTLGRFLDRFEGVNASILNEDFVFISVDSRDKARKFIEKIPENLAEAIAVDRGIIIAKNFKDGEDGDIS